MPVVKLIRLGGGRPVELGRYKTRAQAITVASLLVGLGGHWSSDRTTLIAPDGARYKIEDKTQVKLERTFRHERTHSWNEEAQFRNTIAAAGVIPVGHHLVIEPTAGDLMMIGLMTGVSGQTWLGSPQWVFGGRAEFRVSRHYNGGSGLADIKVSITPMTGQHMVIAGQGRGLKGDGAWVLVVSSMQEMEEWFGSHARVAERTDRRPTAEWRQHPFTG